MSNELKRMETALGFVSIEKKTINTTGVLSNFTYLKDFMEKSGEYTSNILDLIKKEGDGLSVNFNLMSPRFKKSNYVVLSNQIVSKPLGLIVDGKTYAKVLAESIPMIEGILEKQITPFNKWVEHVLGNPSQLSKFSAIRGYEPQDIKKLTANIAKCFSAKETRDTIKFSEFVANVSDYEELVKTTQNLSTAFARVPTESVTSKINRTYSNLNLLMQRIEEDDDKEYMLSKQSLTNLSDLVFEIAESVKLFSVLRYRTITLTKSLEKNK